MDKNMILFPYCGAITLQQVEEVAQAFGGYQDVADKLGVARQTLERKLRRYGLQHLITRKTGRHCVISKEQVERAAESYPSQAAAARAFGVSRTAMRNAVKRHDIHGGFNTARGN